MKTNTPDYYYDKVVALKKELIEHIERLVSGILNQPENSGKTQVRIMNRCTLSELDDNNYNDLRGISRDEEGELILDICRHIETYVDNFDGSLYDQVLENLFEIIMQLEGGGNLKVE